MSSFRFKERKPDTRDARITLNARHHHMVRQMQDHVHQLPQLQREQGRLQGRLQEIQRVLRMLREREELGVEEMQRRIVLCEERIQVQDRLRQLQQEIGRLQSNTELNDYFMNTSDILYHYYEMDQEQQGREREGDMGEVAGAGAAGVGAVAAADAKRMAMTERPMRISDFVETTQVSNRGSLLESYFGVIDPHGHHIQMESQSFQECVFCGDQMIIIPHEGIIVCTNCSITDQVMINDDRPSYKDPPPEVSSFNYRRINHFNECLAQFQAKESTEISEEVYNQLILEIKKDRIENLASLTHEQIRDYLKKLGYNKYYEHIPHIMNRLSGIPPVEIPKEVEEQLRTMFRDIQQSFNRHCPSKRKNFISYSYVLHKFLDILGYHDIAVQFPLLKSQQKLYQIESIWQLICQDMNWPYIRDI